ncbi:hypothetical protein P691DRAFT_786995 [Macrolepiota fuliginosa MF-IS2]|uniref:Uncharacterized protein n=1 Tax=Macrolepiota fuliginosa MF-IS2 TaxID=1400762 RepID=A0A9P5X6F9_9AGAR|nr:hypothetical protein P691DRAFT_786995 [Macrolepiota fuliginosa MF-IS2]
MGPGIPPEISYPGAMGLLKSQLTPEGFSGGRKEYVGRETPSDRRAQSGKHGTEKTDLRPQQPNGPCADTISFSLYPSSHGNLTPPTQPAPPGLSTDTQSLQSAAGDISFTFQSPPQSLSSPADSPTHSDGSVFRDDHHLDAPRRPTTMSATLSLRSRSGFPSVRSFGLHPAPSITSLHPRDHMDQHPSRPSSPLVHSLRPSPSHISIHSQIRGTGSSRAPSLYESEPDPLPIIEPQELSEEFSDPDNRIWTMYPEEVERGTRSPKDQEDTVLEPLTMRFEAPWEPPGWEPIIHPEGQLYFWHEKKRVITEAYLYDPDVLKEIVRHLSKIESFMERMNLHNILGHHDLVLDLSPIVSERGGYVCGYYFVNHEERSIFWLQAYPASALVVWMPEYGHKSKLHLKHEIEAQYWFHCHLFPTTLTVDLPLVAELRDIILHNIADMDRRAYAPADVEGTDQESQQPMAGIQPIPLIQAIVMLNVNVAFLTVQSIDQVTPPVRRRPDQIASYVSVVANMGSIITGLLLIKMNRVRLQDTTSDAIRFINARSSKVLGLETLAIMYSLPFALLMWGMIAFVVAFCLNCFQDTTSVTRGVVGAACLLVAILVGWCVWVGWDKSIHQQPFAMEETWARPEKDMNVVDYGEEYGGNEKEGQGEGAVSEHQPGRRSVDTPSPQQRIGSPHDLENNAGDNPSREEFAEYKRAWDRLNEWWRGVCLGSAYDIHVYHKYHRGCMYKFMPGYWLDGSVLQFNVFLVIINNKCFNCQDEWYFCPLISEKKVQKT